MKYGPCNSVPLITILFRVPQFRNNILSVAHACSSCNFNHSHPRTDRDELIMFFFQVFNSVKNIFYSNNSPILNYNEKCMGYIILLINTKEV